MNHRLAETIARLRRNQALTQEELARQLGVSFQAVSKWENGRSLPDIDLLPQLALALGVDLNGLMGYTPELSRITVYQERYQGDAYYWGLEPSPMCYEVMRLRPPIRPLRLLDVGCGEGKDAVFFARNGYRVTAFDVAQAGVDKARRLADSLGVPLHAFQANLLDFRLESEFDVIFSSGVLHYLPPEQRGEILGSYQAHTALGGLHALNCFVAKPFLPAPPDERPCHPWRSGELFGLYGDWRFHRAEEVIFDCNSNTVPHRHCMDILIAEKLSANRDDSEAAEGGT